jgi:hypothetical protein
MGSDSYPVSPEPNPKRGGHDFRVHVRNQIPDSIGLIFGDFIHNLRASLDNLVYELAFQNRRTISFPVYSDRAKFSTEFEPLLRSSVPPEAFQIIERVQPYHATDSSDPRVRLGLLNSFWNGDKHRTTTPILLANYMASAVAYRDTYDNIPPFEAYFGEIYEGKLVGWVGGDAQVDPQPHFPVHIGFHKKPIVLAESLPSFHEFVRNEIFGAFKHLR